jgi:hypothetical protein
MNCNECGEKINVGDEYIHVPLYDENFHLERCSDGINPDLETNKRIREE